MSSTKDWAKGLISPQLVLQRCESTGLLIARMLGLSSVVN